VMIVLGVVLIVASALLFWVVWKSMEPDPRGLKFEAQERADREMPLPQGTTSDLAFKVLYGEVYGVYTYDHSALTPAFQRLLQARKDKVAGYYATMLARDQGRQREAATKAMLVPAAAGVMCFVLAFVSFRARLIAAGIVLLGLTAVYATFLVAKKDVGEAEAAMYSVVIAVAGLSGLVCTALGMVRLLATRKGA